jgi:hypothetical protein
MCHNANQLSPSDNLDLTASEPNIDRGCAFKNEKAVQFRPSEVKFRVVIQEHLAGLAGYCADLRCGPNLQTDILLNPHVRHRIMYL